MEDLLSQVKAIWRAKPQVLYAVYVVCFLSAFALVWFFFATAQTVFLEDRVAEEVVLKASFSEKTIKASQLPALLKKRDGLKSNLAVLEASITPVSNIEVLLTDVASLALSRGVRVDSITPKQTQKIQFYTEVPVALKLVGSYHGIALLLGDLAKFSRLLVVSDMSIKVSSEPVGRLRQQSVIVDALLKTYVVDSASGK